MAQHVVKESHDLGAWKGTPDDMADMFMRALQLANEADPGAKERRLSITVDTGSDRHSFADLDEFREFGKAGKLDSKSDITAHVLAWQDSAVDVMFMLRGKFKEFSGASVDVSGTNHVAVSGLAKQLERELDKGKRRRPSIGWLYGVGVVVALPLSVIAGVVSRDISSVAGWMLAGIAVLIAFGAGFSPFIVPVIVPGLEILDPEDPRSRYERWRGKLLAGAGALILVVLGAVLQAVLK